MTFDIIKVVLFLAVLGFMLYRVFRNAKWTYENELEHMSKVGDLGLPRAIVVNAWIPFALGVVITILANSVGI